MRFLGKIDLILIRNMFIFTLVTKGGKQEIMLNYFYKHIHRRKILNLQINNIYKIIIKQNMLQLNAIELFNFIFIQLQKLKKKNVIGAIVKMSQYCL